MKYARIMGIVGVIAGAGIWWYNHAITPRLVPQALQSVVSSAVTPPQQESAQANREILAGDALVAPIAHATDRVTKKPFGVYVSPQTSLVIPERFSGYHAGVDFETTQEEVTTDVPIVALCTGKLVMKRFVSGYGGVVVQSCVLDQHPVTVVYGHLRLSSIAARTGSTLPAGAPIGVLGAGYTSETDGERKHLHLGIHRGLAVDIRGYVRPKAELSGWIDACAYVCH